MIDSDYCDIDYIQGEINDLICENKSDENKKFNRKNLISEINELIDDDEEYVAENFSDIIRLLECKFIEYNPIKGEVEQNIYCEEKVRAVLEEIPNIVFIKFNRIYKNFSTLIDYMLSENDYKNFDLVLDILKKEKKPVSELLDKCKDSTIEKVNLYLEKIKYSD